MNISKVTTKLFSARLGAQFIGFLGLTFFARELGAQQMGVFFLFQAVLSLLIIPADFGVREGIEKRISEGEMPDKTLTTGLGIKVLISVLIGLGLLAARTHVNDYIGARITLLLVIALLVNSFSEVATRTLKGELRVGETASLTFARQFVWVLSGSVLILIGLGPVGLIYSFILGLAVVSIWGISKMETNFGSFSFKQANSLWRYSKYSFIGAVGGSFYSWMDVAIIGFFLPQSHVGAYEMAWRVGVVVTLLSSTIAMTIFPQVSKWDATDDKGRIEALLPKVITPSLSLVIPAFFGSLLLSKEILALLFGQEYTIAWLVLIVFMGINFVQATTGIFARVLRAIDQPKLVAKARIVSILINVFLNIVLIWQFGIIGAAIATGIALSVYTILIFIYLNKHINIEIPFVEISWCFMSAIVMAVIVMTTLQIIDVESLFELFAVVGWGALIYLILSLIYKPFRKRVKYNIGRALYNVESS